MLTEKFHAITRNPTKCEKVICCYKMLDTMTQKQRYGQLLMALYHIYFQMERSLEANVDDSTISKLYTSLEPCFRTDAISEDVEHFLGSKWKDQYKPSDAVQRYVRHLADLATSNAVLLIPYCFRLYVVMFEHAPTKISLLKRILPCTEKHGLAYFHFQQKSSLLLRSRIEDRLDGLDFDTDTENLLMSEMAFEVSLHQKIIDSMKARLSLGIALIAALLFLTCLLYAVSMSLVV
uniref:Uncharacterized protein AlNc14C154G7595 n=1 Tax=Albugo laibachii Nc14 TaxID=890382 RepID=F0WM90_9STRA|nr:conserved hypothetical protein [Albugo laibachii Nc14]|eukprot:CCA22420.1 conserved hypothetical protein [Albugo laibachii Nc14]